MEKPISARANDHAEGCKILVERRNKNGGGGGALFLSFDLIQNTKYSPNDRFSCKKTQSKCDIKVVKYIIPSHQSPSGLEIGDLDLRERKVLCMS